MLRRKFLYTVVFILCFHSLAFGEINSSPIISIGKIWTKWKGFLNIPFLTDSNVSFTGITPITLPKGATSFKFGFDWRGENETKSPQKCTIITRVEVETYPNSNQWILLCEETRNIVSKGGMIEEKPIITETIFQEKPEVRYKVTVEVIMPFEKKGKPSTTYITVQLTSKEYTTYTSIPIVPLTILHDPNGDGSYTALQPQAWITHLLSIDIAGMEITIEDQKELLLTTQNGKIKIRPVAENKNTLEISYTPEKEITSSTSKEPCLIGPGLGDTYVLIKNLPVRFKFSKTFTPLGEEIKTLSFCIVTPQEAGLPPHKKFDVILVPAAALRAYDGVSSIFGTWEKLNIDDQIRQQLIGINIGWDNFISEPEEIDVINLGEGYLNFKEQTTKNYTQVNLNKVIFYSEILIDSHFAAIAGIPIVEDKILEDKILVAITLNKFPLNKTIPMNDLIVVLEDDERKNVPGDFFTYQIYQDRRFGSLVFITKDDKSKPATFESLYTRSFSSNPKEYWTQDLKLIPTKVSIYGVVTSTTGESIDNANVEVKLNDKVVKKVTTQPTGTFTINGLVQGISYILTTYTEGYNTKTIEVAPFLGEEVARKIDIILEKKLPQIVELPVEEKEREKEEEKEERRKEKVQEHIIPQVVEISPEEEKPIPTPTPTPTPTPIPTPTPPTHIEKEEIVHLLINGDFSKRLKYWKLIKEGTGKEMYAKVIRSDSTYPYALEIKRTGSMRVRGEMGVRQELNQDVSEYTKLVFRADVKAIHSSLESDGTRGGAYPIEIQIHYTDDEGKPHLWRRGFLYAKKINYPEIGENIPQNKWFTYTSGNLLELRPYPKVIKEVRVLGSGWRFHSRVANIQLIGTKKHILPEKNY